MQDARLISQFAGKLAASGPPPGGGSVAAAAGLMATGLLEMIIRISDVTKYQTQQARLSRLRTELTKLVEADANALQQLLQEGALPFQERVHTAATVPLATAMSCLEVLELCAGTWEIAAEHAVGDLAIAAVTAHAGLKGALTGVVMNLPLLDKEEKKKALQDRVNIINQSGDRVFQELQEKVLALAPYNSMATPQE